MTASNLAYIARGMNPVQATELATQVEGDPNARRLMGLGFSAPLANELATQMTAGVGNINKLMGLGVPPILALLVAADIEAT